jgi:hypothetical protein
MSVGGQPAPGVCSCSLCLAISRLSGLCHSGDLGPVAIGFATDRVRILFNELLDVRARVPAAPRPEVAGVPPPPVAAGQGGQGRILVNPPGSGSSRGPRWGRSWGSNTRSQDSRGQNRARSWTRSRRPTCSWSTSCSSESKGRAHNSRSLKAGTTQQVSSATAAPSLAHIYERGGTGRKFQSHTTRVCSYSATA